VTRVSQPLPVCDSSVKGRHGQKPHTTPKVPRLTRSPWKFERHMRHSVWKRTTMKCGLSSLFFKNLPREVYDCVVEQLEQLHLGQDQSCTSCYLKDLYHLSLTSRAWERAATLQMYVGSLVVFLSSSRLLVSAQTPCNPSIWTLHMMLLFHTINVGSFKSGKHVTLSRITLFAMSFSGRTDFCSTFTDFEFQVSQRLRSQWRPSETTKA
jgi:hypothetical protein